MSNLKFTALLMATTLFAASASTSHSQPDNPQSKPPADSGWYLLLAHDANGTVNQGDHRQIVNAVRQGCQIRIAWGSKGPTRTIEHTAEPTWISIRDGNDVEVQIGGLITNLKDLGEPSEDYPRLKRFGGTDKVVKWRAILKTDGTFDAVWYYPHSGEFIARVPQRHPMKWFADCNPVISAPLFEVPDKG